MKLRTGQRLRSVACDTTVIIVRTPDDDVDLRCGGHPMVPIGTDAPAAEPVGDAPPPAMGKRYEHAGVELLCTKAGVGGLTVGSVAVAPKQAAALPTSD
jgi:hypothetical protein